MNLKFRIGPSLALVVSLLSSCASVPESLVGSPKVYLRDVQVVDLDFKRQTFLLSFDVANPNPFPLPVRNVNYGVRLDGQLFASGVTTSRFTVPADGDASFAISVDLDLVNTAPQLLSVVRNGARQDIRYDLEGRFSVDLPTTPTLRYSDSGMIRVTSGPY